MKIIDVLFVAGNSGFFFDDQKAIKSGVKQDGFFYLGDSVTPGFKSIRQAGESISVMIILENGGVALGDCAAVQYSGAGGRDPLFLAADYIPFLEKRIKPLLMNYDAAEFRKNSTAIDNLVIDGQRLHTALRYGLSQSLLNAAALSHGITGTEVVCREWNLPVIPEPVPLFAQSGDNRYEAVDKMILKQVEALPHGLINNIPKKLGYNGELLAEYVQWLQSRISGFSKDYKPDLHIDVYGTIGNIFGNDPQKICNYLQVLEHSAQGLNLYIEGPVDVGEKDAQIEALKTITDELIHRESRVKIVADEWCNTKEDIQDFADARCCHMAQIKTPDLGAIHNVVDSVLYCNEVGIESYQGGTCNETDLSAKACVQTALATRPKRTLVKPGMGFDEGLVIVRNEMFRTIALMKRRV